MFDYEAREEMLFILLSSSGGEEQTEMGLLKCWTHQFII